jgi:trans-2,3-dihydro-3-hydroxyanthranilate isomerase
MKRRFATLDVFTRSSFAGNPLAVVLDPQGLDTPAMQTIRTRIQPLGDGVCVSAGERHNPRGSAYFSPGIELPFAGHPTVGTAVLLGRVDGGGSHTFHACRKGRTRARARCDFDWFRQRVGRRSRFLVLP